MVFVILGEAYGVNEELDSDWPVSSVGALQAFLLGKKTQDPEDEYATIGDLVEELA